MQKPILITGGTGFIAHQIQRALQARGRSCVLLDRYSAPPHRPTEAPVTLGDVRDAPLVDRMVAEASAVVHLAAVVGVDAYLKRPDEVLDVNITGTRNVLTSCMAHDKPVLFASTSEVYGRNIERLREDSSMILGSSSSPRWSYALSKAVGEHLAGALARDGLRCVITRYFNVYGPLLDAPGQGRVLSKWLGRLQQGLPLHVVDGGKAVRSFCYVDEAAGASADLLLALESGRVASGGAFNVGRDEPVSMLELAQRVLSMVGRPHRLELISGEEAFGQGFEEIPFRVPNVDAIRAAIGFEARVDLDEGLERVLEHWGFDVRSPAPQVWIPVIRPQFEPTLSLAQELQAVLASGRVSNEGPRVEALEHAAADFLGAERLAATSSGSSALMLLARALRPRLRGSAVVIPSFTYIATLAAWEHVGLTPLFCDIDPETFTLAPSVLERILREREDVAAVMGVTAYGVPPDLASLTRLLAPRQIPLLLDDAHGFGSTIQGSHIHPGVLAAAYSLHATKVMPAVEGGLIWSRDPELLDEIIRLRGHGLAEPRIESSAGFNARLDELRATIALRQLRRFPEASFERRRSAERLRAAAQRHPSMYRVQRVPEDVTSNFQNLAVRCLVPDEASLERVIAEFAGAGVEARRYFSPPLHHLERYASTEALPNTQAVYASLICLPLYDQMSEPVLQRIENALAAVARKHGGG